MTGIAFEIHLAGLVDDETLDHLGELDVTTTGASTVLTGEATDQAEFMGLLMRLRTEHLVITEVRRRLEDEAGRDQRSASDDRKEDRP